MATFHLTQGDTAPPLSATLTDADGNAVNLTNATVRFIMRAVRGAVAPIIDAVAVIVSALNGRVRYDWQDGDTDIPGGYRADWEVTFENGSVMTFPNDRSMLIAIHADLGEVEGS